MSLKLRTILYVLGIALIFMVAHGDFARAATDPNAPPPPEFEYVHLDPLMMPIINENGMVQQISLVIALEMKTGTASKIDYLKPRLVDAYIQDLSTLFSSGQGMIQGKIVDASAVKERLTAVTNKIVGSENVSEVLLQVISQRPY